MSIILSVYWCMDHIVLENTCEYYSHLLVVFGSSYEYSIHFELRKVEEFHIYNRLVFLWTSSYWKWFHLSYAILYCIYEGWSRITRNLLITFEVMKLYLWNLYHCKLRCVCNQAIDYYIMSIIMNVFTSFQITIVTSPRRSP